MMRKQDISLLLNISVNLLIHVHVQKASVHSHSYQMEIISITKSSLEFTQRARRLNKLACNCYLL